MDSETHWKYSGTTENGFRIANELDVGSFHAVQRAKYDTLHSKARLEDINLR